MRTIEFAKHDIVQLSSGSKMIIVEVCPTRPANPYIGVSPQGNGRRYKFGYKHHPTKIGVASESHPALIALRNREGVKLDNTALGTLSTLVRFVEHGNIEGAKILAGDIRKMIPELD